MLFETVGPARDHFLAGAIASLHDMISKLQRVVCHLNDRLSTIEQMSGLAPPVIAPATSGQGICRSFFETEQCHGQTIRSVDTSLSAAQEG